MSPANRCAVASALLILDIAPRLPAQDPIAPRSRDTVSAYIVGETETVLVKAIFGRPPGLGRRALGDLVPYDKVWITGTGEPTQLVCPRPFRLGDLLIPSGTFSLWTLPTRAGVTLIVNRRSGPDATTYDSTTDVGRVPLITDSLQRPVEPFSILFWNDRRAPDTLITQYDVRQSAAMHGQHYTAGIGTGAVQNLVITWDTFRWTVPIRIPALKTGNP